MRFKGTYNGDGWSTEVVGFDASPIFHLYLPEFKALVYVNLGSAEIYTDESTKGPEHVESLRKIKDLASDFVAMRRVVNSNFLVPTVGHDNNLTVGEEPQKGIALNCDMANSDYMFYDLSPVSSDAEAMVVMAQSNVVSARFSAYDDSFSINVVAEHEKSMLERPKKYCRRIVLASRSLVTWPDDFDPDIRDQYLTTLDEVVEKFSTTTDTRDFSWLRDKDYIVVERDPEEWKTEGIPDYSSVNFQGPGFDRDKKYESVALAYLKTFKELAFDTETTGLNFNIQCLRKDEGTDTLVGFSFSPRSGQSFYFPIDHFPEVMTNLCERDEIDTYLHSKFKILMERRNLVGHNVEFDWRVMWAYGINCNFSFDTLAGFRASLDTKLGTGFGYGLKHLSEVYLNRTSLELSDLRKELSDSWEGGDFRYISPELARYYVGADTDNTWDLYQVLKSKVLPENSSEKVASVESSFASVIAYQAFYGHHISMNQVPELGVELQNQTAYLMEKIRSELTKLGTMSESEVAAFKPNSPKQLGEVLFTDKGLGLESRVLTATGQYSTSAKALKPFKKMTKADGSPKYPLVNCVAEWADLNKLMSAFTKPEKLAKETTLDGLRFSRVQQFLATGRVSSSDPNYQSYDDRIKRYVTPRPGYYAADADYSSVEYRIMACMAPEQNLIEKFHDPDMDIHRLQAAKLFDKKYDEVTTTERKDAKGLNFGLAYGMGNSALGNHLFGEETSENTRRATALVNKFFEGQENLKKFFEQSGSTAERLRFATTFFGRRRYFMHEFKDAKKVYRAGGNHRIQGTAADLYKMAMIRLMKTIARNNWMGMVFIDAFVHDEAYMEVHSSINPALYAKVLHDAMMMKIEGWCPLYIGMGFGANWYEAKSVELPVQVQNIMEADEESHVGVLEWWDNRDDMKTLGQMMEGIIANHYIHRIENFIKKGKRVEILPEFVQSETGALINTVKALDIEKDKGVIRHIELDMPFGEFKESLSQAGDLELIEDKFYAVAEVLGLGDEAKVVFPKDRRGSLSTDEDESSLSRFDKVLDLKEGEELDPLSEYKRVYDTTKEAAEAAVVMGMARSTKAVLVKNTPNLEGLYDFAKKYATPEGTVQLLGLYPKEDNAALSTDLKKWSLKKYSKGGLDTEGVVRVLNHYLEIVGVRDRGDSMLGNEAEESEDMMEAL